MLKKKQSPKIDEAVARSINFEVSIADLAKRSERRAWIVAMCSVVVSLILIGGYFYILPLKEKVPYIVLADPYSGTSTVARLSEDLVNRRITANEAVNRSNIAHFVLARESYDLALTNMHDWPTVMTMSSPEVSRPYIALHSPNNEFSPYKQYGTTKAIRVKILSIVLMGGGNNTPPKGATVRFQRSVYDKTNGGSVPLDSKIATMEFVYKPNLRMDDQSRVENPLGFQVLSYRVDNDYGSAPPAEAPASPAGTNGAATQAAPATAGQAMDPDDMPANAMAPGQAGVPSAIPLQGQTPQPAQQLPPGYQPLPAAAGQEAAAPQSIPRSAANGGRR